MTWDLFGQHKKQSISMSQMCERRIYRRPSLWVLWILYIQKHYYKKYYWWKVITYQTYLF